MAARMRLKDLPAALRKQVRKKVGRPRTRTTKAQKEAAKALREEQARKTRESFFKMLDSAKLPHPVAEHRFHPERKWRFDWAWVDAKVAVEQEGGVWTQGRHSRGAGMVADMAKYNNAAVLGWKVFRVTPQQLSSQMTESLLRRALRSSGNSL